MHLQHFGLRHAPLGKELTAKRALRAAMSNAASCQAGGVCRRW